MRKVALLTMQRSNNYGAALQAYALQQRISGLGADCELLDLLRPLHAEYRPSDRFASLAPYSTRATHRVSLAQMLRGRARHLLGACVSVHRNRRFAEFDATAFRYSRPFHSADELYAASLNYDAYVTGSDQVWNPSYPYSPEPYFLTFAREAKPRIAYAPSFGVATLHSAVQDNYRKWLNGITSLSVREHHGAEIIRSLTGRSAEVVLDPTLLLDASEWAGVAVRPRVRKPYILCYSLSEPPGFVSLCRYVREATGYPMFRVEIGGRLIRPGINTVRDAGPREFLGWIMDAALVVTNSFHGTCLSILFRKPFHSVLSSELGPNSRNSRLESLLDLVGLRDRALAANTTLPTAAIPDIDYDAVHERLAVVRDASLRYLQVAIMNNATSSPT